MAAATDSERALAHWREIQRLGLESYVAELDVLGYTIVPPELAGPDGFGLRLRDALLDVAERRTGERPKLDGDPRFANPLVPFGQNFAYLLFEDEAFAEAILNPRGAGLGDAPAGR